MFGKSALIGLLLLCSTVLILVLLSRDRLCSVDVKSGGTEISALFDYEAKR